MFKSCFNTISVLSQKFPENGTNLNCSGLCRVNILVIEQNIDLKTPALKCPEGVDEIDCRSCNSHLLISSLFIS